MLLHRRAASFGAPVLISPDHCRKQAISLVEGVLSVIAILRRPTVAAEHFEGDRGNLCCRFCIVGMRLARPGRGDVSEWVPRRHL